MLQKSVAEDTEGTEGKCALHLYTGHVSTTVDTPSKFPGVYECAVQCSVVNSKRVLQYMYEAILYIVCSHSGFALV